MSKHFQNACAPYLHPSICMWKACICRCQDFTKGQTELKPWESNISEGLRRLVFMALVYVIVGGKKVRWFSAEINPSRVGVYFGFGHFCQMALSGGLTWLAVLHTYTFCSHVILLIKILQFARELSYRHALGHFSAWSAMSRNGMAAEKSCQESKGKQEKDVLGVTVATGLLNLTYTGSPKSGQIAPHRRSPSWVTGDAMTSGPPCPHQWVAMMLLPAWPSLLSTLHCTSCFAAGCDRGGASRATAKLHFLIQ